MMKNKLPIVKGITGMTGPTGPCGVTGPTGPSQQHMPVPGVQMPVITKSGIVGATGPTGPSHNIGQLKIIIENERYKEEPNANQ